MPQAKHSAARANILGRLRDHAIAADPAAEDYAVMASKAGSDADRVNRFCDLLQQAHAEVLRVAANDCCAAIAKVLKSKNIQSVLLANGTELGAELKNELAPTLNIKHYPAAVEPFKAELFADVDAAVTNARWGIAETGTLVLWPDANEPRTMSLVPPLHVAVVDATTIVNTFFELLNTAHWVEQGMPTNALLISGPSKTADIQQVLAYGAHGPCELIVIVRE